VAVEVAAALGLAPAVEAEPLLAAADKVAAMLTGLIRKHSGTPREGVSSGSGSGSGGPDPAYRSVSDFQSGLTTGQPYKPASTPFARTWTAGIESSPRVATSSRASSGTVSGPHDANALRA